jgi:protein phosphatase
MRALGTTAEVDLDLTVLDVQAGDRYLLCSDGLSGFVPFNTLASTLAGYGDPHHAAETLIQHALRGGGADNITCIVADAFEQAPPGARPPSQAETQYLELPVIVGAAAENQGTAAAAAYTPAPDRPSPATDPNVTGVIPAAPAGAPQQAASAAPAAPGSAVDGREDTAELEAVETEAQGGRKRRWVKPVAIVGTCVVVLGGLGAGGYFWSQQQYYVGADSNGHVAIYQGVDYSVAGFKLSHVYSSATVTVAGLPTSDQAKVHSSITATSLGDAKTIVSTLSQIESYCTALTAVPSTLATSPSTSATPTDSATKTLGPTSGGTAGTASGRPSGSASAHPPTAGDPSTGQASSAPAVTPTPSMAPSSSVSSGIAGLHQLSAQCPANTD